ncbi:hypothetical protein [Paenarthrobacter sp. CAP02]
MERTCASLSSFGGHKRGRSKLTRGKYLSELDALFASLQSGAFKGEL